MSDQLKLKLPPSEAEVRAILRELLDENPSTWVVSQDARAALDFIDRAASAPERGDLLARLEYWQQIQSPTAQKFADVRAFVEARG